MKALPWVALVAALIFAGLFVHDLKKRAVLEERANVAEHRADSLYAIAEESQSALAAVQIQARALIAEHDQRADSALSVARQAQARRPSIINRVVQASGPDSALVRLAVNEVVDSLVTYEIRPRDLALQQASAVRATLENQLARTEATLKVTQEALEGARAEAEAQKAARPGWLSRTAGKVLPTLLGFGVGYLIAH